MAKIPVYKLAKELRMPSKKLLQELKELHIEVKGHTSTLDEESCQLVKELLSGKGEKKAEQKEVTPIPRKTGEIQLREGVTVGELAHVLHSKPIELIQKMIGWGIIANINQSLGRNDIETIASKLDKKVEVITEGEERDKKAGIKIDVKEGIPRAPVVTVLGHVDHGKTTLLDAIRKTNVAGKEKGEITQHIGASVAHTPQGRIVFLDTPGHEAFTALRARGAKLTDIAVLVVAADNGVQPQTVEAIDHAKSANIPIIVAINKIDRANADVPRVKSQLVSLGLVPEDMGGHTLFVEVSAQKRENIDQLLEVILLETEMLELKADPEADAEGYIIETKIDKGKGSVASALIKNGTLRVGDFFVVGNIYGKVRALLNDVGKSISEAPPSTPVEILGFSSLPVAGDYLKVQKEGKEVKKRVEIEKSKEKEEARIGLRTPVTLETLHQRIKEEGIKDLPCIIKADVGGSIEALQKTLETLGDEQVQIKIVHKGIGSINRSDVLLASTSGAVIIGFNTTVAQAADELAKENAVQIKLYEVIYDVIDDLEKAMQGLITPESKEIRIGKAEVRQVISISKGTIAGVRVLEGVVKRKGTMKILRGEEELYCGKVSSLRHFKDNVNEVKTGLECGIGFPDFKDFQEGDIIEVYEPRSE